MEPVLTRPWYKKKRYLIPTGIAAILALSGGSPPTDQQISPQTAAVTNTLSPQSTTQIAPQAETVIPAAVAPSTNLSNDNYYTNSVGNQIHSSAYSNTVPAGASAQCRDGTFSFSKGRRGTCSHHGGVADWL